MDAGQPRTDKPVRIVIHLRSADRVRTYDDGTQLYRCVFEADRSPGSRPMFAGETAAEDFELRVLHHTSPDAPGKIPRKPAALVVGVESGGEQSAATASFHWRARPHSLGLRGADWRSCVAPRRRSRLRESSASTGALLSVRSFNYQLTGVPKPVSGNLDLDTDDIADAAIREITQLSLNASPFGFLLEELLVTGDPRFRWVSALGHVRETKTALSGLFGRFVARAYLEAKQGYAYFAPIVDDDQRLSFTGLKARRNLDRYGRPVGGDRPDWAIGGPAGVAIAEAKGTYNEKGPAAPLKAATVQAQRFAFAAGPTVLTTKRWAVASRWAVDGSANLQEPHLAVHDPEDGERDPTPEEAVALSRGVALAHHAALLGGMGLTETASAVRQAIASKPGQLKLPPSERIVRRLADGREAVVYGMIVTPFGFIRLPAEASPETRAQAASDLSDGQASLLSVGADALQAIDAGAGSSSPAAKALAVAIQSALNALPPPGDGDFWRRGRRGRDGTEWAPLEQTQLSRPSAGAAS
jgi:hypothetical protein